MKMYFKNRTVIRAFTKGKTIKPVDAGADAKAGRRWYIEPKAA